MIKEFGSLSATFSELKAYIKEHQNNLELSKKDKILNYLSKGQVIAQPFCADMDPISGDTIGQMKILSDGEWVWMESMAHFIEKYNIGIPSDFLLKMEKLDFIHPTISKKEFRAVKAHIGHEPVLEV